LWRGDEGVPQEETHNAVELKRIVYHLSDAWQWKMGKKKKREKGTRIRHKNVNPLTGELNELRSVTFLFSD
jgi:hypothetical protein